MYVVQLYLQFCIVVSKEFLQFSFFFFFLVGGLSYIIRSILIQFKNLRKIV